MGIAVGNKIELVRLDQIIRNEENKKVYVSKIYDIAPKRKLQIAMPIYEGRIVPLDLDDKYSACFYTERGLLQCNVLITSRYKSGNLFFLEVLMLGELEKVQRRQFYRYSCMMDAKLRMVSDHEYETGLPDNMDIPESELDWQSAKILDISGGGARIVQKQDIKRNEVIKIRFAMSVLNDVMHFSLLARILSSTPVQGRTDLYEQRMEFLKISRDDRDKIIRFIFESERMERAKGWT